MQRQEPHRCEQPVARMVGRREQHVDRASPTATLGVDAAGLRCCCATLPPRSPATAARRRLRRLQQDA
jgi:hypothetical protein